MSRVLIVDDDADIRLLLRIALGAEGHDIAEAANGRAALDLVEVDPFDVVLLDLMMPVVDGWEFLRTLGERTDEPPAIVAVTALATHDHGHLVNLLEGGALDVVAKPFETDWLVGLVGRLASLDVAGRNEHRAGRLAAVRGTASQPEETPAMPVPQALVDHLLEHSVRRGDFVLKSGARSDWFIDAKQTTCRPEGMVLVADAALAVLPEDIDAIGGLTMGADAVAFGIAAIAATRGRSLRAFSVRKEEKDHGAGGRIAGALEPGDRVVIVEDAVTRGVSMLEAAAVVRSVGAEPVLLLPVVDRGGTVGAMAEAEGLRLEALVTALDLGFAYEGG